MTMQIECHYLLTGVFALVARAKEIERLHVTSNHVQTSLGACFCGWKQQCWKIETWAKPTLVQQRRRQSYEDQTRMWTNEKNGNSEQTKWTCAWIKSATCSSNKTPNTPKALQIVCGDNFFERGFGNNVTCGVEWWALQGLSNVNAKTQKESKSRNFQVKKPWPHRVDQLQIFLFVFGCFQAPWNRLLMPQLLGVELLPCA